MLFPKKKSRNCWFRLYFHMTKTGQTSLLPGLHKILTIGYHPKPWSLCYSAPTHKRNDICETNYYRGIIMTNAIGKMFN